MSLIDKLQLQPNKNTTENDGGNSDEYSTDPIPGQRRKTSRPAPTSTNTRRVATAKEQASIADEIEMYLQLMAGPLELRGLPYGMELSDRAEIIAQRAAKIVARNPKLKKWFESGSGFGDWMGLAQAVWPVALSIYRYHVVKSDPSQEATNDDLSGFAPFSPSRYATNAGTGLME